MQNSFTAANNTKFPTKNTLFYPTHLKYVAVYLGKLTNKNSALFMHVKHVSNVTFYYHRSNRYLSKVMKICAKTNTMQNINILLFVCSLSSTACRACSHACTKA